MNASTPPQKGNDTDDCGTRENSDASRHGHSRQDDRTAYRFSVSPPEPQLSATCGSGPPLEAGLDSPEGRAGQLTGGMPDLAASNNAAIGASSTG